MAVLFAVALVDPAMAAAGPAQEGPARSEGGGADGRDGQLELDADPFRAEQPELNEAFDSLSENVSAQLDQLSAARTALAEADADLQAARDAVAATEARIAELTAESDRVVVDAFMNPPTELSLAALSAESLSGMTIRQSILDTEADNDAAVLEELGATREVLETQQAEQEEATSAAQDAADAAESELTDLQGAQSQQALFVVEVQNRIDRNLAEAAALADMDPELAASIRARESDVAGRIQEVRDAEAMAEALEALQIAQERAEAEAAAEAQRRAEERAAAAPGDIGAASGSLTTVSCPSGGSITVDSAMGDNLEAMLGAASADGIVLCGGGYRDPQRQIDLRRQNCGSSSYAIYEMPSSSCSPPTARPGSSNHESGLAVDLTCNGGGTIQSRSSSCFEWLDAHADDYGFYNLPSEPWHWSNDGT